MDYRQVLPLAALQIILSMGIPGGINTVRGIRFDFTDHFAYNSLRLHSSQRSVNKIVLHINYYKHLFHFTVRLSILFCTTVFS